LFWRARTRDLCRDRAATTSKSLESNGVGRYSLVRQDILSHCYRPLNVPRSEALVPCPRLASRFKVRLVPHSRVGPPRRFMRLPTTTAAWCGYGGPREP
jgi:hypothetical protein